VRHSSAEGIGYYRAQLDGDMLVQLLDRGMPRLSLPERVSVIDDVHALVRAGTVDVTLALGLVQRYAGDDSRHMVTAVAGIVDGVRDVVPDELRPNFARFIRTMFGARARQLGWVPAPDEDDDTRLLRSSLLRLVTDAGAAAALATPSTRRLVYDFVKEQLDALLTRMPPQAWRSLVQVGVAQCDAALKADMEAVFKERISTLPGGPRVFAQALERLDLCAQQRETHRPGVVQFLRQY
jgi:hypothetical protein